MVVVEDLESVVVKLARLTKVWSGVGVSMELLLVDGPDHPLSA